MPTESVVVSVTHSGRTEPQEQIDEAFKRFWRGDLARSNVGLILDSDWSLVKTVTALGGSIHVRSKAAEEFEITVLIPSRDVGRNSIPSTVAAFGYSGRQLQAP